MSDITIPVTIVTKSNLSETTSKEVTTSKAHLKDFQESAKGVSGTFTKMSEDVSRSWTGMMQNMIVGWATFEGAVKFKEMIQGSIEYGASIENMSRKLGMSTTEYQKLSYVAKQSGGDVDRLGRAFSTMSKLAETSNSILGVSTRDANGNIKAQSVLFEELLDRIAEIPNPTERMAASMKIFGMSGREVFNIASQGKERIHELMQETATYGLVLDKGILKQLHDAEEAQNRFNMQLKVASAQMSISLLPAINAMLPALVKLVNVLSDTITFDAKILSGENIIQAARDISIGKTIAQAKAEGDVNKMFELRQENLKKIAEYEKNIEGLKSRGEKSGNLSDKIAALKAENLLYGQAVKDILTPDKTASFGGDSDVEDYLRKQAKQAKAAKSPIVYDKVNYEGNAQAKVLEGGENEGFTKEFYEDQKKNQEKVLKLEDIYQKALDRDSISNPQVRLNLMKSTHAKELALFESTDTRKLVVAKAFADEERMLEKKLDEDKKNIYQKALDRDSISTPQVRLNLMKSAHAKELALFESTDTRKLVVAKAFADEERTIEKKLTEDKINFQLNLASQSIKAMETIADAAKANAQVKKRLAEGEAIIDGAKAVMGIWATSGDMGQPAGSIFAGIETALVVATTLAQVAKIESTKFAYGGVATGGIPGVDSVPALLMPGEIVYNPARPNPALANMITSSTTSGDTHVHIQGPTIHIAGSVDSKTVASVSQATAMATKTAVHQALRQLQSDNKISGVTIRN